MKKIKLNSVKSVKNTFSLTESEINKVEADRKEIKNILDGKSEKKLLIIGPCSMDFPETVLEYAKKLKVLADKHSEKLFIVMRCYSQKPRTTVGWKGMLYSGEFGTKGDINSGIETVRKLMIEVVKIGLPIADEMLYTETMPYFDDLVSYLAVGARNSENQSHREVSSLLDIPVGIKNPTSGDLFITVNNIIAASKPQQALLGGNFYETSGNKYAHIILRGQKLNGVASQNISEETFQQLESILEKNNISTQFVIDISHDNSGQNGLNQPDVLKKALSMSNNYPHGKIVGFMAESYLFDEKQKSDENDISELIKGKSLTDSCLGIEKTEKMLEIF